MMWERKNEQMGVKAWRKEENERRKPKSTSRKESHPLSPTLYLFSHSLTSHEVCLSVPRSHVNKSYKSHSFTLSQGSLHVENQHSNMRSMKKRKKPFIFGRKTLCKESPVDKMWICTSQTIDSRLTFPIAIYIVLSPACALPFAWKISRNRRKIIRMICSLVALQISEFKKNSCDFTTITMNSRDAGKGSATSNSLLTWQMLFFNVSQFEFLQYSILLDL